MPKLKRSLSPRIFITWLLILLVLYIYWVSLQIYQGVNSGILPIEEMDNLADPVLQETRATFLTVQTQLSPGWCRMQASAILSGISVVTLGFGKKYSHTIRPRWILQYIEREHLNDSHVLVFLDGGDAFFTSGDTMQRALTRFIATTAATADEFDAKAVIEGKATAPFLFGAEEDCWGSDNWYKRIQKDILCRALYAHAYKDAGYAFNSGSHNSVEPGVSQYRHLNAGTFISRVWAFKKAAAAFHAKHAIRQNITCDQSVWTSIYLESMIRNSPDPKEQRVPRGLISLDFRNSFSLHPYGRLFLKRSYLRWNQSAIDKYIATRKGPSPHFFYLTDNPNATPAIVHFPGWRRLFIVDIPRIIETTAWVRESQHDARSIMRSAKYLRNRASVQVYREKKGKRVFKYGSVCFAGKVMNAHWLGKKLSKE